MITNKNNAKRFSKFGNNGQKYYNFVNRIKFFFDITNEYDLMFVALREIPNYTELEVHHIDSNSQNNSAFNLVVLPKLLHKAFDKTTEKEFWQIMVSYGLNDIILEKQRKLIGVI